MDSQTGQDILEASPGFSVSLHLISFAFSSRIAECQPCLCLVGISKLMQSFGVLVKQLQTTIPDPAVCRLQALAIFYIFFFFFVKYAILF